MKAGCPICKTGGDSKLCTCSANCMYPSCQWKVASEPKPTFRILTHVPKPRILTHIPEPFGPHAHSPPSYGPDCDCELCRFYTELARNNPSAWPDPIEHRTQGIHYWGDTHLRKVPGPPLSLGTERQDKHTVQATLQ